MNAKYKYLEIGKILLYFANLYMISSTSKFHIFISIAIGELHNKADRTHIGISSLLLLTPGSASAR
jgi:hypothetical protein